MRVVLDAWPLTAILAGGYAATRGHGQGSPFWALCRARSRAFDARDVDRLARFLSVAKEVWTTPFVAAEAFYHLEQAAGRYN